MYIKINELKSSDLGFIRINSFQSPMPVKIEERVEILGKNGTTLIGVKWSDREIVFNGVLVDVDIRDKMRELAWFFKPDSTEVLISFGNEPNVFYVGSFKELTPDKSYKSNKTLFFEAKFTCRPEYYVIIDKLVDLSTIIYENDIVELNELQYLYGVNPY